LGEIAARPYLSRIGWARLFLVEMAIAIVVSLIVKVRFDASRRVSRNSTVRPNARRGLIRSDIKSGVQLECALIGLVAEV
jgi:hypothetical protein